MQEKNLDPMHDFCFSCLFIENEGFLIVANGFTVYRMNIDGTLAGIAIPIRLFSFYIGVDYHYE